MTQVINTNVASLNSQRSLNMSQASLATSLQRLSSGLRINSAKDDAAGLAISARMTSQINGLNQASRNANDGISLAQTAEGGLQSVTESLQRMRELAVQSSNATNSATDRAAIQQEVNTLVQQINTVASQTSFNGVKLLDGTFNAQAFQVGANAGETVSINSISSAKADALGVGTNSSYKTSLSGALTKGGIAAGGITVNGFGIGPTQRDGVSTAGGNDSAIAKAAAFNAVSGQTGVTATAGATSVTGAAVAVGAIAGTAADSLYVNGVNIGAVTAGADITSQANNVSAAINAISNQTGVTASFDTTTAKITLTAADGRNISLKEGTTAGAAVSSGLTAATDVAAGVTAAGAATTFAALAAGDLTINGVDIGAVSAGTNATTQGTNVGAAINALTSKTGVTATVAGTGIITLTTAAGQDISIGGSLSKIGTTATNTGFTAAQLNSNSSTVSRGAISLTSNGSTGITLGGADIARAGLTAAFTAATASFGAGLSTVDVSTASGAQNALATIDSALANINSSRANLGAVQNRFTSVVSNLATTTENLSASRSRILDADFAAETANLSRAQIMQQAGTAMLAQANSLPNGVLSLLR